MNLGFYRYKATVWNDDKNEDEVQFGFVYGESYSGVALKVEAAYGSKLIDMSLCAIEPSNVLTDKDIVEAQYECKF